MKVVKRDGREVEFDKQKIVDAILKSFDALGEKDTQYAINKAKEIANYVEGFIEGCDRECLGVETIQDLVEEKLMKSNRKDVAKHYILYRDQRTRERERKSQLIQDIGEKITASNVQNQNANVDEHSFGGRMGEANSVVMKKYALDYCMSDMARNNHLNNEIYEHDLDHFVVGDHNCLTVPFDKLLATGFNTRQTDVRPAQSVNTAFQLVAVIFQLQSLQQFGGVSASHIDWTMVPYVRKSFYKHYADGAMFIENKDGRWLQEHIYDYINDPECFVDEQSIESEHWKSEPKIYEYAIEMTKKETYQAVEGMYHNLNTLQSRSGNQLPFTSINYGTCTLPEGRMVTKAILDVSIEGIGALHKTSIFPCGIFQYMKGVNDKPGTPNYDLKKLAIKSTAKRLYPNYVNVDWSVNKGYDRNDPTTYVSTMGCRTYNGFDINGFGQKKDGRGNICPVTIIMPTLAMEATEQAEKMNMKSGDYYDDELVVNRFFEILDTKIHEAKDMLIERFNWICSQSPDSAKFMYENGLMEGYIPEEGIRSALKHGTIVIGQIGLAETLQILIGCDHTTEKGMELAKKIEQLFKDRCAEFKQEYKLNFGVYYTPAENLCFTAMKKFKDKYGVIPNVSDKKFFTNSIHVPVWKKMNPFEKIDIESQLTGYSNAGCITYVELESSVKNNLEAVEAIIDYAMEKDVPYFAINVPNDLCLDCGYTDDINKECPQCGGDHIQRLRRVTGYLTGDYTTAFNEGKQQETEMRYKHSLNLPNWKR